MRVVSDYQVCSPVDDTMCCRLLIVIRVMVTLYAPVAACDNYRRSLIAKLRYTVLDICLSVTVL